MAGSVYGYREGVRRLIPVKIDSGGTFPINVGDMLSLGTAGYYSQSAAGDIPHCVACEAVPTAPTSDGDIQILADFSEDSVYEYPADTGSVTQALAGVTMDVGGPQSINIDASADDVILVRRVDTDANTVFVQLRPTYAGVV